MSIPNTKKTYYKSNLLIFRNENIENQRFLNLDEYLTRYDIDLLSHLDQRQKDRFNSALTQINELITNYYDLEKARNEATNDFDKAQLESDMIKVMDSIDQRKSRLDTDFSGIRKEINNLFEKLSASIDLGFDLIKTRYLKSHPSGERFIIQSIDHTPVNINRPDLGTVVEIKIKAENSSDPATTFQVRALKDFMERNNLYPEIASLENLNLSIYTTNRDIEEKMSFSTDMPITPNSIKINSITQTSIILDNEVKPFENSNFSTKELDFGIFAHFINSNQFKPLDGNGTGILSDIQGEIRQGIEENNLEDFLSYEEASKNLEEDEVIDVPYKYSYLKDIRENTMFFSIKDLVEFIKHIRENYKGSREVMSKYRQGKLGEAMFSGDLKEHFKQGKRKPAERDMMESAEKALKSKPPSSLIKVLQNENSDKFSLEVAFNVLSEQGFLDLWDTKIWENLFKKAGMKAIVPKGMIVDPNNAHCKKLYDKFSEAVNTYWDDPNQFSKWERSNLSNCASKVSGVMDRANRIISSIGFAPHMEALLQSHVDKNKKDPVDPHEYEAMLISAMENGKGSMEEKIYYILMGLTLKDKNNKSILSLERLSQMNKALHSKYIPLTFLNSSIPRPPEGKEHPITRVELELLGKKFLEKNEKDLDNRNKFKPNQAVKEFIWNTLIPNPVYKDLATNEVRNLQNIDPAETQYFIPLASENLIKTTCITQGGIKIGMDGFANGFAGFSQYLSNVAKMADKARKGVLGATNLNQKDRQKQLFSEAMRSIKECIKSYVIYEGILTDKYEDKPTTFIRLDSDSLINRKVAGTNRNAMHYIEEMNTLVKKIVTSTNNREFSTSISPIYSPKADIKKKTQALRHFSAGFENAIKDGDDKLLDMILSSKLTGIA